MPANQIQYSEKYYDEIYEYRSGTFPPSCEDLSPCRRMMYSIVRLSAQRGQPTREHQVITQKESILTVCFLVGHRHVVLPQDLAKLLPKGVLLSEARLFSHK